MVSFFFSTRHVVQDPDMLQGGRLLLQADLTPSRLSDINVVIVPVVLLKVLWLHHTELSCTHMGHWNQMIVFHGALYPRSPHSVTRTWAPELQHPQEVFVSRCCPKGRYLNWLTTEESRLRNYLCNTFKGRNTWVEK